MVVALSTESSSAFSFVVTIIPAFPSAAWVWEPAFMIESGIVFSSAKLSAVQGKIPSSSSTMTDIFLESLTSTASI